MTTYAQNIETTRNLLGCIDALVHQVKQMKGMFPDEDGAIQQAIDDAEEGLAKGGAAIAELEAHRAGALVVVEGGVIQNILTTGHVDVLKVEFDDGDEPLESPVEVRHLEDDGTWQHSDTGEAYLYGQGKPATREVAIVESRISEYRRTDGRRC